MLQAMTPPQKRMPGWIAALLVVALVGGLAIILVILFSKKKGPANVPSNPTPLVLSPGEALTAANLTSHSVPRLNIMAFTSGDGQGAVNTGTPTILASSGLAVTGGTVPNRVVVSWTPKALAKGSTVPPGTAPSGTGSFIPGVLSTTISGNKWYLAQNTTTGTAQWSTTETAVALYPDKTDTSRFYVAFPSQVVGIPGGPSGGGASTGMWMSTENNHKWFTVSQTVPQLGFYVQLVVPSA